MNDGKVVSIRDQISEQIRTDIISGDLAPNTKLNEQSLADRFGVSRGPIRDVLLQLTKEGLLVSKKNCGVSVNSVLNTELQDLMVDLRKKIETFAITSIIDVLSEEDFLALDTILKNLEDAFINDDFSQVTKIDIDFHRYFIERAGGEELLNLWYPIVLRMRMNYKRVRTAEACVGEHRAIVEALKSKVKENAVKALRANIS